VRGSPVVDGVLVTRPTPPSLNCAVPSVPNMEVAVSLPGGRLVSVAIFVSMFVSMLDGRWLLIKMRPSACWANRWQRWEL
jgi:hypothetical protein